MADGDNHMGDGHVLEFTPETGFDIRNFARMVVSMMKQLDMDAVLNLPEGVAMEIPQSATEREIVTAYKEYQAEKLAGKKPSNANEKPRV